MKAQTKNKSIGFISDVLDLLNSIDSRLKRIEKFFKGGMWPDEVTRVMRALDELNKIAGKAPEKGAKHE